MNGNLSEGGIIIEGEVNKTPPCGNASEDASMGPADNVLEDPPMNNNIPKGGNMNEGDVVNNTPPDGNASEDAPMGPGNSALEDLPMKNNIPTGDNITQDSIVNNISPDNNVSEDTPMSDNNPEGPEDGDHDPEESSSSSSSPSSGSTSSASTRKSTLRLRVAMLQDSSEEVTHDLFVANEALGLNM